MMSFFKKASLLSLCLLLAAGGLVAQSTTGRIIGTVMLEDGSSVPGCLVEAISPKLVGKATAVTDENGNYRLLNLTPGVYTITFSLQGLQTFVQKSVNLSAEQTLSLNAAMKLGEMTESITVSAMATQIDVRTTAQGQTLTKEVFQTLPKGRNFDSLMTTIPGVQNEPMLGGNSVDGATGLENVYYVDGVDTTNIVKGSSGQAVSFDFVDEVRINSSGYSAEFGGSLGGVVNVITRSGGNEFHGDILGYYSGSPLRADYAPTLQLDRNDPTSNTASYDSYEYRYGKNDDHRFEGGINLGGYLMKDKLWFFGSFMPVFYQNTRTVTHFSGVTKDWKQTWNTWNYQFKLTSQLANNLRISAGFVSNSDKFQGATGSGGVLPNATNNANPAVSYDDIGYSQPNYSGSLSVDWSIGNLQVNLRGGYFHTNLTDALIFPDGPQYFFETEAPGGYYPTSNEQFPDIPAAYKQNLGYSQGVSPIAINKQINEKMSVNGDFSYYLNLGGDHAWKAGFQYTHQGQDYDAGAQFPIIRLAWDRDLIAYGTNYGRGTYGYYAVRGNADSGPYGNVYEAFADRWAVYLQDSWTISDRLTVNFGVRSEAEYIPSGYSINPEFVDTRPIEWGFGDKLAPRLGFIWDVNGDASTKVSGSFGLFYDVCKLQIAAGSYGGNKWVSAYYPLNTYEWDKIGQEGWTYENMITKFDFREPSYDSTDPDMKPMSQREISLAFEQRLTDDIAFKARLVNKTLLWAIEDIGILNATGGESYYITNPGSDYIKEKWLMHKAEGTIPQNAPDIPKASREYWGVNLSLDKRFSNNWLGGIAYTWSSLKGNYSGLASGDENGRTDPNVARYFDVWYLAFDKQLNPIDGPMAGDRPHVFKAFGSYVFDFGLSAGFTFNAMSGIPVSTIYSMDYQGYLPFNRGDLGRSPFLTYADLNISYDLKLGKNSLNLSLNIENVFNTSTAMAIYSTYNQTSMPVSYQELADNSWTLEQYNPQLNPRFKKEMWYYGDGVNGGTPFRARFGIKFSF